jgi:hypothetical protein
MPQILTTNAILTCPHGGLGTSLPVPQPRQCTIQGGFVLLNGDSGLIPCGNTVPCTSYVLNSMNLNSTRVDGRNVMLVTDFIQSATGFPLTPTETHFVFDKTPPPAPAPPSGAPPQPAGPAGTTPPEVPPELREDDKPTVTVVPPLLPFSVATFTNFGTPPLLLFTFTIHSEFPRRWTLFHISPPTTFTDVTNGLPPGVAVVPPGGTWSSKTLVITVTVTGLYASSLTPGFDHSFVLTAVNHRGLAAFDEAKIKVTT